MDTIEYCAEILKAISQPTRLRIIEFLSDGEHCVCEIFPAIGHEQSNTSRHLQMMLKSGILQQRKDGLKIFYSVRHPEVLDIVRLGEVVSSREAAMKAALFNGRKEQTESDL